MALPDSTSSLADRAITFEKHVSIASPAAQGSRADQIRIVAPHEYKEAAATLAEAFRNDPVVRYAVDTPDRMHLTEEERFTIHRQNMEYVTYAHCLNGLVLATGDAYDCVALWLPPGKNIDDWLTVLRSGIWRMVFSFSKQGRARFFSEWVPLLSRTKLEVLGLRDKQSWYLNYIGTKASSRGKGHAKKLMQHVFNQADREGLPCYLESSHAANLAIYTKMGFELQKQIYLQHEAEVLKMDVMVREPVKQMPEKGERSMSG